MGGGDMAMKQSATQWAPPADDLVLYRAVIDHTAQCTICAARPPGCPIAQRLTEMARAARDIARDDRLDDAVTVRVGADTGKPTGPHCRTAELAGRPALHLDCARQSGKCACYCHGDQPPTA
ncbi:hypothetical protein ACIF6K_26445 [Streptomyces sp. NPDC085942]|uniref:hypothetical protein n=1 Tax=Streptomyces sp. NPDC085942 TaxID=3365743 RepID=UPI0037CE6F60